VIPLNAKITAPSEEQAKGKKQKAQGKRTERMCDARSGAKRSLLLFAFCLLPSAFLLTGCSPKPPPVKVEQAKFANFAAYRTYAWLPSTGGPDKDLFGERARNEIEVQLAGKGYVQTLDGPNLLVQTEVVVEERNAETLGDFARYEAAGGTQNFYAAFAIGYEEARLTVNVYDAATRQRLWRGMTPVAMDAKHRTDRAAGGVVEMFKSFPAVGGVTAQ
jgi:hypothetical protein